MLAGGAALLVQLATTAIRSIEKRPSPTDSHISSASLFFGSLTMDGVRSERQFLPCNCFTTSQMPIQGYR
jgi:hypothetical protein